MPKHKCTKELYKAFLQASSVRYSSLALSEVAPYSLSHGSVNQWSQAIEYRSREIWSEGEEYIPVDYRDYNKDTDGKTKNDHFRAMLKLAKARGISPEAVVMDAWYSSLDNLKAIPDEGLKVYLRGYGWVTVFRFVANNGRTGRAQRNHIGLAIAA